MKYTSISFLLLSALLYLVHPVHTQTRITENPKPPEPEGIIEAVGIHEGMIIGEAGAGDGYFTFPLARKVGETGRIYANDIDRRRLQIIERRCVSQNIYNITTVIGEVDNPLFPVGNLDMVIMRYVFHDLTEPIAWMKNVKQYMNPDALLVIIDMAPEKISNYHENHPYRTEKEVREFMAQTDFILERIDYNFLIDNIYFFSQKK